MPITPALARSGAMFTPNSDSTMNSTMTPKTVTRHPRRMGKTVRSRLRRATSRSDASLYSMNAPAASHTRKASRTTSRMVATLPAAPRPTSVANALSGSRFQACSTAKKAATPISTCAATCRLAT